MSMERLQLHLFQKDYIDKKEYSYISQLAVITIKSLLPMMDEEANRIDYKRFTEEFKLWLDYRNGDNSSLLNCQGRVIHEIYWGEKDDSIISRIIPIVLANKNYNIVEEEIIKNILFTTGNLQGLFEGLALGYLLHILVNPSTELEDLIKDMLIESLKDKIISFSQKQYMEKYQSYYRLTIESYDGNFKVEFEREKLKLLNSLYSLVNNTYPALIDCLKVVEGNKGKSFIGQVLYNYLYRKDLEFQISDFHLSLGEYIINLRKSRIDPEKLKIKDYILPDIFSFEEGDSFYHSLLREVKVIKKEVKDKTLTSLIQTKTGMYLFRK
ncbi:MAG: hypothetical protein GX300_03335 [Tissierellia bacterium]|nr:hypothetical protein [Tissierellia bacterium]